MPEPGIDTEAPVALVTGAGSGIGRASAHRLSSDGYRLVLTDVDPDAVERVRQELRGTSMAMSLDVTDPIACTRVVSESLAALGRIDALVHSAGVTQQASPAWETSVDEWHRVLGVNLHGTFHVLRAVVPSMVAAGRGRIVALASIAAKDGNENLAAYSAAKAGVVAMVKSMGKELARTGVLINAVAPAMIDTAILSTVDPERRSEFADLIPMGRIGRPEEVAALVAWLVSDDLSFSTGAVYDISGGRATY